jgi:glycosyltransferase involved in cell wall biosynthesis
MRILGLFAPTFVLQSSRDLIGANVASIYFAITLLSSGDFDEAHLYATNVAHLKLIEEAIREHPRLRGLNLKAFLDLSLNANLARYRYTAFYSPSISPALSDLAYARRALGADFRILAGMSTISYPAFEQVCLGLLMSHFDERDMILCCSTAARDVFARLFAQVAQKFQVSRQVPLGLAVVPYGVDTAHFAPGDREAARKRLGLMPDEHYVLSLARFSVNDKFDYGPLIEAFRLALPYLPGRWRLVLAGGAENTSYLEYLKLLVSLKGLQEQVVFAPNLDETLKGDLYNACDVFVSPSDNVQESFGLTLVEAMACGLPVVCSDWDGYKDLVVHGETGLRVPTYMPRFDELFVNRHFHDNALQHLLTAQSTAVDITRLSAALIELGQNPSLRAELGANGRRRAEALFSFAGVGAQLREVLHSPPPPMPTVAAEARMSLSALFEGYATRALEAGDRLQTTRLAAEQTADQIVTFRTPELEAVLLTEIIDLVSLDCLAGRRFGDLVSQYASSYSRERVIFTLYSMLKQGLLRLVPAEESAGT